MVTRLCLLSASLGIVKGLNSLSLDTNVTSLDGTVTVILSAEGITGIRVEGGPAPFLLANLYNSSGKTTLTPGIQTEFSPSSCAEVPGYSALYIAAGGVASVSQTWSCIVLDNSANNGSVARLIVTDTFVPSAHSVRIDTTVSPIDSSVPPFTSTLQSGLFWGRGDGNNAAKMWMPWGKGCTINYGTRSTCRGLPNWCAHGRRKLLSFCHYITFVEESNIYDPQCVLRFNLALPLSLKYKKHR